jgi:osmoprotectant transport system permease protein
MEKEIQDLLSYLPEYLGNHLLLSMTALLAGVIGALPLSLVLIRYERLRKGIVPIFTLLLSIPGFVLLAFMVPMLGKMGFLPVLVALTTYGMFFMLLKCVRGLKDVDPHVIEAAYGVGMSHHDVIFRVRFPLAVPTIISGVRKSTMRVTGLTTLSTPIGATSLGNYIFIGLENGSTSSIMIGCIATVLLLLILDQTLQTVGDGIQRRIH